MKGQCSVPGCDREAHSRGVCKGCYGRLRRNGGLPPVRFAPVVDHTCEIPGCEKAREVSKFCRRHAANLRTLGVFS